MSIKRINVLLRKELVHGSKGFFFIFAVAGPLILTLLVNLVFGSIFAGKPRLGILDMGDSQITQSMTRLEAIDVNMHLTEAELKLAVETGSRDVGVILAEDLDIAIQSGDTVKMTIYIWGESLLKDRAVINAVFLQEIRGLSGQKTLVDIETHALGDKDVIPWKDRFLPLMILMAIFISGFVIPSSSLVIEKEHRTIGAVLTTPASQLDMFIAKGLMGVIMSMIMGTAILFLNQAVNAQSGLMLIIMFFGAIMASCFGLILGAFMKETNALYSAIKGLNLFIYAPGIVQIFPKIPTWIGRVFPTYYVVTPIMNLAREGASWPMVQNDMFILIGFIVLFVGIVVQIARRVRLYE